MRLDVSHPGVLPLLFVLLRHMQQNVETTEIRIAVNDRSGLLILDSVQLMDRFEKLCLQAVLLPTKPDLRDMCALLSDPYVHQISDLFVSHDSPTHAQPPETIFRPVACPFAITLPTGPCGVSDPYSIDMVRLIISSAAANGEPTAEDDWEKLSDDCN